MSCLWTVSSIVAPWRVEEGVKYLGAVRVDGGENFSGLLPRKQ